MLTGSGSVDDLGRACDAAVHLLATGGASGLSVRAIAHEMNLTGPALTHRWDNKQRLWGLLVSEIGDRWLRVVRSRLEESGPSGIVPASDDQVAEARVWLAVTDLARADPGLAFRVDDVASRERTLLGHEVESALATRPPEAAIDALHATAVGLRERVCTAGQPWSATRALEAWRLAFDALAPGG